MTDPKTARDCLAHCLDMLTDEQFRIAVERIEWYAGMRAIDAIKECIAVTGRVYAQNLFAPPKDTAQ